MSVWERIEGQCRSVALSGGLEARVADPLWMLARQWQVGELRGDDAARPVGVAVTTRSLPLATVAGAGAPKRPLPASVPLEYLVEQVGQPIDGDAGLHGSARIGHRLLRMLDNANRGAARRPLLDAFPLSVPTRQLATTGLLAATASLVGSSGLDGQAVLNSSDQQVTAALDSIDASTIAGTMEVIATWRAWCVACGAARPAASDAWDDERLEYSFAVTADDTAQPLALAAPEHTGGVVDWFSFNVATDETDSSFASPRMPEGGTAKREVPNAQPAPPSRPPLPRPPPPKEPVVGDVRTSTNLPAPVRYRGQPAQRWWQFEDRAVNFADIEAGPADLARMLVTEFAVAYSDDWFVVPARVRVGSVTEVTRMVVVDNFGAHTPLESVAVHDGAPTTARSWRMFEMTNDVLTARHLSPWLVVPSTATGDLTGEALERVTLIRDEGANLVWGIERLVEGPSGRPMDRATLSSRQAVEDVAGFVGTGAFRTQAETPVNYENQAWRYRLESGMPPSYWIPFLPEQITESGRQIRLRRSRMQQWSAQSSVPLATPAPAGACGTILDPTRPCWIREEEVPRSGIRVDRRWRYARGDDGRGHLWLQLEKKPAGGERSSGVRWDVIEINAATPISISEAPPNPAS